MENEIGRRKRSCPATKRNGELCEVTIVSASGYCFAHDPESAEWRGEGGRGGGKKRRGTKKKREGGGEDSFYCPAARLGGRG
ncbi:MAG: hypothetical protein OXC95_14830, partial [Dehalococcoidia bacterium]|nr:hypothetical protein [Dehalococcoidia bacterium]